MNVLNFIVLCLIFGMLMGVYGVEMHLYDFIDMSSTTDYRSSQFKYKYFVSDKKEFSNSFADFIPEAGKVIFYITNYTKDAYDFKDTDFYLVDMTWRMFKLIPDNMIVNDMTANGFNEKSSILNPGSGIQISCNVPNYILSDNIRGFRISRMWPKNDVNMRFGYLPRPIWWQDVEHIQNIFKNDKDKGTSIYNRDKNNLPKSKEERMKVLRQMLQEEDNI